VDTGQPVPVLNANQLDDLVAPIALYPDPLISQILVASTYPLEVVEAYQWLQRNPGISGPALTQAAESQNWDPSVQALVMFPDVLKRLNEDVAWTTNLGNAFLAQQADVMGAVQRMRQLAEQNGKLASTAQQQVLTTTDNGQPVVQIVPTNPNVIYVPTYDPAWVWGPPIYYPYPRWYYGPSVGFYFGTGIPVGLFLGFGWGGWGGWGWHPYWGSRTVIVNNAFIHRYNFNTAHLATLRGTTVWSHDSFHRQGVPYPSRTLNSRYRADVRENLRPRFGGFPAQPQARTFAPAPGRTYTPQTRAQAPETRTFTPRPGVQTVMPRQSMGTRPAAPTPPPNFQPRGRSAFGGIENGNSARFHTDRGYSSLGPSRMGNASHEGGGSAPVQHGAPRSNGGSGGHGGGGRGRR
jgi:hypothetical protein